MSAARAAPPLPSPLFRRGPASVAGIGDDVTRLCGGPARVALIADPALAGLGLTGPVEKALAEAGHETRVFSDLASDPHEAHAVAAAAAVAGHGAACVVAMGGGSALDVGKLAATLGDSGGDIARYRLAAEPLPARTRRLIAVPTTAGTGSEATSVSVLAGADGTKYWYWHAALLPDLAVLDPLLTLSLPRALTLATGIDALVHAVEAATNRNRTPQSDEFALGAIGLVAAHLGNAAINPRGVEAREAMLNAAALAGIAINTAGTAMAHAIGHALGSLGPVPHGHAVAIGMAASLGWAMEGEEAHFADAAEAFGCEAGAFASRFPAFLDGLGFDARLPAAFDGIAAGTLAARIAAPENAAMVASTRRAAGPSDFRHLAGRALAMGRGEDARP